MQNNLPEHIFIIPDGNRRWAGLRKLMPWQGHAEGTKRFHEISELSFACGIPYFTFWAASEDNLLKRNPVEVKFLTNLIHQEIKSNITERLFENRIRLRVIGKWKEILSNVDFSDYILALERQTSVFENRHLTILLGYSGKTEIAEVARAFCKRGVDAENITFDAVKNYSWTGDLPSVDLEIRTGEEKAKWSHRSSGALPFLTTDSACYHTEVLWPDFLKYKFSSVLDEYTKYERRYGA